VFEAKHGGVKRGANTRNKPTRKAIPGVPAPLPALACKYLFKLLLLQEVFYTTISVAKKVKTAGCWLLMALSLHINLFIPLLEWPGDTVTSIPLDVHA
jgi:hypothetical protein